MIFWKWVYILGENFFFSSEDIFATAIFKSFRTCFKGQMLTFHKQPLMSQDKNHLVQGFLQTDEGQEKGGISHYLKIPTGALRK